ncbi:MAG: isoleucine--tRNA ligase [Alphaproteobacteria bacterium]|nr:isoleucine--tRNA ligase [Alphaproteobacteria bacterium]
MSDKDKTAEDRYRESVFLPKTDFPMRGGLPQKEPEILQNWSDTNLYAQMRASGAGKPKYVLHDGPPYANGNIHMGHAVNKILKDVIVKSFAMSGFDAPYVPGWDCHGLPIEWKIEEQYRAAGKDKDEVDILAFREECRKFAQSWVDTQSTQFQRLGVTGDWENPYRTMTNRAESKIVQEIHKFAMNGGLYKGLRPVMWSTVEKTALAEAEVEYKEHKSITVWVKFPVVDAVGGTLHQLVGGEFTGYDKPASIVIWTTTPWTIPSNRAIACNEDLTYIVFEVEEIEEGSSAEVGERLIVAENLLQRFLEEVRIRRVHRISSWPGHMLVRHDLAVKNIQNGIFGGITCAHPLRGKGYDFDVPVLSGEFVTDEAGTGFVHIAPGHGEDDFLLGKVHNLEVTDNVTDDGKFRPHVPLFAGLEVYTQDGKLGEGNFAVLRELADAENLLAKGSLKHDYPHSWRSKAPVIFRTTPQWFIAMDGEGDIRKKALKAISDTAWHPAKGEARITAMIANRPDWCISRQRAWGVPIALFLNKDTGEVLIDDAVFARIADYFEAEGADAWWAREAQDFLGDKYKAEDYTQVFDIVDVWFESGSTHAFVVGDTQTWPCFDGVEQIDLYLEGSDQHRGWFHSSLLECTGTRGHAPYKNVLTHGFVLDEKGYKMSKSLGNVVDPLKMMDTYGADIIRLWVMLSDYAEDIRIGNDTLKTTGDLYRRIRNTLRFLLGALEGFTPEERVDLTDKNLPELERYMLHKLSEMDGFVRESITGYEFGKLAKALHDFCNEDLSAFYFDIRKDSLYCDRPDSLERRACRTVMAEIFSCLSAWLAPILAFTTEEAWSYRPQGIYKDAISIHLREFPQVSQSWKDNALAEKWEEILEARAAVLAAIEPMRASKELGSSLEASATLTTLSDNVLSMKEDLADICIVSAVEAKKGEQGVQIQKASGHKCARCWKVLPEVTEKEPLCNRCADAVEAFEKTSKAA